MLNDLKQLQAGFLGEGAVTSPPSLRDLAADARSRVPDPPAWDAVAEDAKRLRLGALQGEAAVMAGLMTDSVWMTSSDHWPSDVNEALHRLGLFEKHSPMTLHGVFAHLSSRGIGGLTNSVKGTLLELSTVHDMNHAAIPMAPGPTHAELAHSLNQPGWDIAERGADGHTLTHVQVKATDHWQTIAHHLSRYPKYPDVATTHEGAQTMLNHGVDPHHVIDTGIHAHTLTNHVASNVNHLTTAHSIHEVVPEVAIVAILAVAALKLRNGETRETVKEWAVTQIQTAGIANLAGLAVQLMTGTAALRSLAAIGSRFTFARGAVAGETGETLRRTRATLRRIRERCEASGYTAWSAPPGTALDQLLPR